MILNDVDLLNVLTAKPNKELIEFGIEQRRRALMHMYGIGMKDYLTMIEGFEKPFMNQIRVKYAQSNKDLIQRSTKPINKIFSARGNTTYYNLSESQTKQAAMIDTDIWQGISVKKWMELYWKNHMLDDPMGLIFMEIDAQKNVYPTYKSIIDIHDYKLSGDKLEYVIFNVSQKDKKAMNLQDKNGVYRVVDDLFDRIIIFEDGKAIINVNGQTFPNYFTFVPGIVNSSFPNPTGQGFISPLYWVFDLADQYLLKTSIRITHELRHGFPKYYEYADTCIECKGSKKKNGKDCTACNGTGKRIMTYVSDVKLLEYPGKETPAVKGAPGGYIEPSKIFSDIVSGNLVELEERINQTLWGSKTGTKLKPGMGLSGAPNGTVTATEVMDNRQPEVECLVLFSSLAESRDKFITDCAITYKIKKNYFFVGGCSKNYGRRFLLEDPDTLLERYFNARKEGLSASILYGLYEQYLEAKYQNDGVSLSLYKKLMKVEPFMHYTVGELKNNGATPEQIRSKVYYGDWLASMNNDELIMSTVIQLQTKFNTFISGKPLPVEEKPKLPVSSVN